jgi:hypothetical protein
MHQPTSVLGLPRDYVYDSDYVCCISCVRCHIMWSTHRSKTMKKDLCAFLSLLHSCLTHGDGKERHL